MNDLTDVAERLRLVMKARQHFLKMWEIDRNLIDPAIERVARDLEEAEGPGELHDEDEAGPGGE
jgi:hypothetical protein